MRRIAVIVAIALATLPLPARGAKEAFKGEFARIRALGAEERLAYFGLQYLMNDHQKRQYLSLETPEERERWIESFWIDRDPTPATPENERRIEHEKRVALARKLFGMKKAPGWDRRGETLIRWGMPSQRTETHGTVGFYEFTPPGEVWYYRAFDMIVQFSNFNLKGEFFYASDRIGRSSRRELDRIQNISALAKYGVLQQLYPIEYMSPDEVKDLADWNPDEIDYIASPDVRMAAATFKDLIAQWEAEKIRRAVDNFYTYRKTHPAIYSFEINQALLPLYFDVTGFRGGGRTVRTEISFEVPASELLFVRREGYLAADVLFKVLVRDIENRVVAADSDLVAPRLHEGASAGSRLVPGQVVLALEPGYYRIGVEAHDRGSGRRAAYRTNVELESYERSPSLSDIQFSSGIAESEEGERFRKGTLQVVPHPARAYRPPFPLSIYFEIYGLEVSPEGIAYYRIEYRIIPLDRRRAGLVLEETPPAISSSFETSGYGAAEPQRLSIATENLREGRFRLVVTVTDRRSFRTATRFEDFTIIK
jgi:GWxTD domain-containing protein